MQMTNINAGAPVSSIRKANRRDTPRLLEMIAALAAHHGDTASPTAHSPWMLLRASASTATPPMW